MILKKIIIAFVFLSTGAFVFLKVMPEKTLSPIKNIFSSSLSKSQEKTLRSVSQTLTSGYQNPSTSQTDLKSEKEVPVPEFNKDNPQAKGVILAFHRWPDEKEKALIVKKLTKAGLKKKEEFQRFKSWVFEWPEWHKAMRAEKFVKSFPLCLLWTTVNRIICLVRQGAKKRKKQQLNQNPTQNQNLK